MSINWSGYQIPGYLAARQYRDTSRDVGSALGSILNRGLSRQDVETYNMAEALRGQGRSYYKDKVDHSDYKKYEKWLEEEGGRYLQAAEAGAQFQNVGGKYQMKTPGGKWVTMGEKGEGDDGIWNPYAGGAELNQFEKEMQQLMQGKWGGGTYTYRTPKTPLGALFSKERYRPVSNLYQDFAKAGLYDRHTADPGTINWAALSQEPASLGWYPGKMFSGQGILGKLIQGKSNEDNKDYTGNVETNNNVNSGGINVSGQNAYYIYRADGSRDEAILEPEYGFKLKELGINQEDFANRYTEHLSSIGSSAKFKKALNPNEFAKYLITGDLPDIDDNNSSSNQSSTPWSYSQNGITETLQNNISSQLVNSGITSEQFTKKYEEYLKGAGTFPMSYEQFATYLVKSL